MVEHIFKGAIRPAFIWNELLTHPFFIAGNSSVQDEEQETCAYVIL